MPLGQLLQRHGRLVRVLERGREDGHGCLLGRLHHPLLCRRLDVVEVGCVFCLSDVEKNLSFVWDSGSTCTMEDGVLNQLTDLDKAACIADGDPMEGLN